MAYDDPIVSPEPPIEERRTSTPGRRAEDRRRRFRDIAATVLAFCGGLAVLYLFFAAIGTVDIGDAIIATLIALGLAIVWLLGAFQRWRSGADFVTRRDRERRGY